MSKNEDYKKVLKHRLKLKFKNKNKRLIVIT